MSTIKKTALRMNMERYVNTQLDGDVLSELVKNGIEAEGATQVTIELDREAETLTITNDGNPVENEDDFDRFFLEIGTTGKDEAVNFGKGFSAVFLEQYTIVKSGNFIMDAKTWDNISIERTDTALDGTSVLVSLKPDSEILAKSDAEITVWLRKFLTDVSIVFNDREIETLSFDKDDYTEIESDCWVKYGTRYHGFLLADGKSVSPVKYSGTTLNCSIIIGDIRYVNTERTSLKWHIESDIKSWYEEQQRNRLEDAVDDIEDIVPYIILAKEYIDNVMLTLGTPRLSLGKVESFREVVMLSQWMDTMTEIALRAGMEPFTEDLNTYQSDDQRQYRRLMPRIYNSDMRTFGTIFFGAPLPEIFSNVVIGVYVENGEPFGSATVEDAASVVNWRVIKISEAFTTSVEFMDPFIATYVHDELLELISTDWYWVDIHDELRDKGMAGRLPGPPPDFRNFIRAEAGPATIQTLKAIAEGDMASLIQMFKAAANKGHYAKPEDEPSWKFEEIEGIPVLVHESVGDLDSVRFTPSIQRHKWATLFAVTNVIMDYSDGYFGEVVIPTLFLSKNKFHKNVIAMSQGDHISLNAYGTKLPKSKRKAALVMFIHVVHELCHRHHKRHDRQFAFLFESTLVRLLTHPTFLKDLYKAVM